MEARNCNLVVRNGLVQRLYEEALERDRSEDRQEGDHSASLDEDYASEEHLDPEERTLNNTPQDTNQRHHEILSPLLTDTPNSGHNATSRLQREIQHAVDLVNTEEQQNTSFISVEDASAYSSTSRSMSTSADSDFFTNMCKENDGSSDTWWDTDQYLARSPQNTTHVFLYEFRRGTQAHEYFSIQIQKRIHVYEWILDERQVNWTPDENASSMPRIISLNRLFQFILLETTSIKDIHVTVFVKLFPMFFKLPVFLQKLQECWEVPDLPEWKVRSSHEFHVSSTKRGDSAHSDSDLGDENTELQVKSLDLLHHRTKIVPKIQTRVLQLLYRWVTEESSNILRTEEVRESFHHVLNHMSEWSPATVKMNPHLSMIAKLRKLFDSPGAKPLWEQKRPTFCQQLFANIPLSASKRVNVTSLLFHTPKEVAESLTLLDYMLYNRIEYFELSRQRWSKQKTKHQAPNLNASIALFNLLGNIVTYSILTQGDERKRKSAMKKWIMVIQELIILNGLNVLMAIVGALGSASIHRLRQTWHLVKEKHLHVLSMAKQLISSDGNFKNLRKVYGELHIQLKPASPYLGFYLKDLILSDEGSPNFVDGKLNFSKAVRTHRIIDRVLQFQCKDEPRGRYKHLKPNEDIIFMVEHYKVVDEDVLYGMSMEAEERR